MFGGKKQKKTGNTAQEFENVPKNNKRSNSGKVKKVIIGVCVGAFAVITAFQSFYSLQEDEYAVVQTFGYAQVVEEPGINPNSVPWAMIWKRMKPFKKNLL